MAFESSDSGEENATGDNQSPPNESPVNTPTRDPWETGLRRRRPTDRQYSDESSARRNNNGFGDNAMSHHANIDPCRGSARSDPPNSGFVNRGSCENGAVSSYSTSAAGAEGLGLSPSTPYKTPTKESMLVPITPSTETISGETVDSTFFSPRSHRGRKPLSLRRQYQLLENQTYILLGSTFLGLVLFLLFTLPLFALLSLVLMTTSLVALVPVATSAIRTRYQLEVEQPMGLLRYLPDSIRVLLTETTLHEYMSDSTFFMETRYLLLYFVPGIQPDQLMNYINQLPQRHRDALLQPGLGRLMPSLMNRLVRLDNPTGISNESMHLLQNGGRGDMSTSSLFTPDREENENSDIRENSNIEITLVEAIASLRQTVLGQLADNELPVIHEVNDNYHMDESSTREIGRPREVVVELPQIVEHHIDENENQRLQAEYATEERILSDATSAAVANYSSQATTMVSQSAAGVVETVSSLMIRLGSYTGLIAGGGGTAMMASLHSSSFTRGLFSRSETESRGENNPRGDSSVNRNMLMYGLLATSVLGFASAGVSYLIRNRVRTVIAQNRETRDNQSIGCSEKKSTII
jgi:hypothetical protein